MGAQHLADAFRHNTVNIYFSLSLSLASPLFSRRHSPYSTSVAMKSVIREQNIWFIHLRNNRVKFNISVSLVDTHFSHIGIHYSHEGRPSNVQSLLSRSYHCKKKSRIINPFLNPIERFTKGFRRSILHSEKV
jgi:hypothetical protein